MRRRAADSTAPDAIITPSRSFPEHDEHRNDHDAPKTFKEVWLISAGHGLTHWYTATFYLLLPLIGKELGFRSRRSASS